MRKCSEKTQKIILITALAFSICLNRFALSEPSQDLMKTAVDNTDEELQKYRCRFGNPDQCNEKAHFEPTQYQHHHNNNNNNEEKKINGDSALNSHSDSLNKKSADKSNLTETTRDRFQSIPEINKEKASPIFLSNSVIALTLCTAILMLVIFGYICKKKCNRKLPSPSSIEAGTELKVFSVNSSSRELPQNETEEANGGYLVPKPVCKQSRRTKSSRNNRKKHIYEEIDSVLNTSVR